MTNYWLLTPFIPLLIIAAMVCANIVFTSIAITAWAIYHITHNAIACLKKLHSAIKN